MTNFDNQIEQTSNNRTHVNTTKVTKNEKVVLNQVQDALLNILNYINDKNGNNSQFNYLRYRFEKKAIPSLFKNLYIPIICTINTFLISMTILLLYHLNSKF